MRTAQKIAKPKPLKAARRATAAILLASGAMVVAGGGGIAGGGDGHSQALKIIQDSKMAYHSLSSYSDTGKTIVQMDGLIWTNRFSIHVARPTLYRIEWEEIGWTSKREAVWSAGDGDFFLGVKGTKKLAGRDNAMVFASGVSVSTVPATFLDLAAGNSLKQLITESVNLTRQKDERAGTVDCYVVTGTDQHTGATILETLWIGKEDHLIHQSKRVIENADREKVPANIDAATKERFRAMMQQMRGKTMNFTETHENISVNQPFKKSDFIHEESTAK